MRVGRTFVVRRLIIPTQSLQRKLKVVELKVGTGEAEGMSQLVLPRILKVSALNGL